MTRRYYAPELPLEGGFVPLPGAEAQHASRVMRAAVGDSLVLFDGLGHEAAAVVASIDKRNCTVSAESAAAVDRELSWGLHMGIAMPKPDRAKEMVERLTELGVTRLTPVVCERTQRPPSASLIGKLQRAVIEASKQCGRNVLMRIDAPIALDAFVDTDMAGRRMIAHPGGAELSCESATRADKSSTDAASQDTLVLIGPEGGFTDEEVDSAKSSGFHAVGLGKRIYRIETAACAIAVRLGD